MQSILGNQPTAPSNPADRILAARTLRARFAPEIHDPRPNELPALAPGLHEWFAGNDPRGNGLPPMSVLIGLAWRVIDADPGRRIVWIGRHCWPYPPALVRRDPADLRLLRCSLFVDPASKGERVWAIELAARCPAVAAVLADGAGLTMPESRRLQLAAGGHGPPILLARPSREQRELSAARTRWRVTPIAHEGEQRRGWEAELRRCKGVWGASPREDARRWAVWRDHATGDTTFEPIHQTSDVDLAAPLADRPHPAPRARLA
ncbi:MAG: hypothetical protein H6810_11610 [Phycisphaeraceae bacterium]|nr:MAG: hypothetical protein H6810_11610 [Phycisphaeraceae bacterium]